MRGAKPLDRVGTSWGPWKVLCRARIPGTFWTARASCCGRLRAMSPQDLHSAKTTETCRRCVFRRGGKRISDYTGHVINGWRVVARTDEFHLCWRVYVVESPCCGYPQRRPIHYLYRSKSCANCYHERIRVEPGCVWCGGDNSRQPGHGGRTTPGRARECMACNKTRHRRGTYPCGKPRRKWIQIEPVAEHVCSECERWARTKRIRAEACA